MQGDSEIALVMCCRATREIKRLCPGCKISGGVSNIAFGFRGNDAVRRGFHSAFLHYACKVNHKLRVPTLQAVQLSCWVSCCPAIVLSVSAISRQTIRWPVEWQPASLLRPCSLQTDTSLQFSQPTSHRAAQ